MAVTLVPYSHVVSGLQEMAAQRFEVAFDKDTLKTLTDSELSDERACRQNVGKGLRARW